MGCEAYFMDVDGDGWGSEEVQCQCAPYGLFTALKVGDCSPFDSDVNPGAEEVCNDKDDDCDEQTDPEGVKGCKSYYVDDDGDNWGTGRHIQLGDMDRHYRYFALNVKPEDVTPHTMLRLVRMMWRVEVFHKRRLRQDGWRNAVTLPQLMQVLMIVIAAGAIQPLLQEKENSRKKASTDEELPELTNEELVEAYFSGRELELIALAFKNLVLRTVDKAVTWVRKHKQKLVGLVSRRKEMPLLAG